MAILINARFLSIEFKLSLLGYQDPSLIAFSSVHMVLHLRCQ